MKARRLKPKMLKSSLEQLRNNLAQISSGWNGEDRTFTVNGETYHEEDAHIAEEGVDLVDKLLTILERLKL